MRILKKYPNRRLYDTRDSVYVTLEDVRQMVLANQSVKVVDSKTGNDLTRSVLLQIIAEQEGEGHEPLLTNRVLQQLIRFYGNSMQGLLSRYIEQSVMIFLEQQELYQRRMRDVLNASPLKLVQRFADQNVSFWRGLVKNEGEGGDPDGTGAPGRTPPEPDARGPGTPDGAPTPELPRPPPLPDLGDDAAAQQDRPAEDADPAPDPADRASDQPTDGHRGGG